MKALVLAGGLPQIALINELKKRGIVTVLADYFENPVAKEYADIFYRESTLDVEAITRVAKREKVDFLITVCTDQALLTVAKVSEELGLPCYIDYQTALNVTNKSYMKRIFAEKNIPTAHFAVMAKLEEECIRKLNYPLIERSQGGAGGSTSVLTDRGKELLDRYNAYEQALKDQANTLYDRYFGGLFA